MMKKIICALMLVAGVLFVQPVQEVEANVKPSYGVVYNVMDQKVIYEDNAHEKMYPASMTKVMSVLVAKEKITNLDEQLIIQPEAWASLKEQNASTAGFDIGAKVTYRDLLYGTILPSGAETVKQLALSLFGSEQAMVDAMNAKATELNLKQTNFVNTTGLHDENHYSSAYDIAIIMNEALKDEDLKIVMSADHYRSSNQQLDFYHRINVLQLMIQGESSASSTSYIEGGKTGYTNEAGQCLVSFGMIQNEMYIVVATSPVASADNSLAAIMKNEQLYKQIDTTFERKTIIKKGSVLKKLDVKFASNLTYDVKADKDYTYVLPKEVDIADLEVVFEGKKELNAPLAKGQTIGKYSVSYQGEDITSIDVKLTKEIERNDFAYVLNQIRDFISHYYIAVIAFVLLLVVLVIYLVKKKNVKKTYRI